jgi:hypothetical protein
VERFATPLLGIAVRGVYLMAYVRDADGRVSKVWISHRGDKVFSPNMLDMTAAGGVRADQTPL